MLNAQFFAAIRSSMYPQGLSQDAVDNMNAVTTAFDGFTGHDHCTDDLAYVLATVRRECGNDMNIRIEEYGRGQGKAYGLPAGPYKLVYFGRGPCQTTWLANYQKSKIRCNIDFVQFPDKMRDSVSGPIAMLDGMYGGIYTGKGLRTYITPGKPTTHATFVQCRRIINGLDHADEVADSAVLFQAALLTGYDKPSTVTKPAAPRLPQFQPQSQPQRGLWADLKRMFGKGA